MEPVSRAPINYRRPAQAKKPRTRFHEIERDHCFNVFSGETAMVNLDPNENERLKCRERMRNRDRRPGLYFKQVLLTVEAQILAATR